MGYVPRGNNVTGQSAVFRLIIKEHIGLVSPQEVGLLHAAKKQALVQPDTPGTECPDDTLMGRRGPCGDQGRSYRAGIRIELVLQSMQRRKKRFEWPAIQRLVGRPLFRGHEFFQPLFLVDPFRVVSEQNRVAVERKPEFFRVVPVIRRRRGAGKNTRCRHAIIQGIDDILLMGREKKLAAEWPHVPVRLTAAGEGRPLDRQAVMFDRVKNAQARIGGISGKQDNLNPVRLIQGFVDRQEFLDQVERIAGRQGLIFTGNLVPGIGFDTLLPVNPVALPEIEQGTAGCSHHQPVHYSHRPSRVKLRIIIDLKQTSDVSKDTKPTPKQSSDVSAFLEKVVSTPARRTPGEAGRLIFGMDATASRESTWDRACHLQGQMFDATADIGDLSVQLCYYRGFNEFHHSAWCSSAGDLLQEMSGVRCLGGYTQIGKMLNHASGEHRRQKVRAVVFVGDAVEEDPDELCHLAGKLGVLKVPLFMFQEGHEPAVRSTFQQMARLSGGAFAPFNLASASELKNLLAAVAVYAAGGRRALEQFESRTRPSALLTHQLK